MEIELKPEYMEKINKLPPEEQRRAGERDGEAFLKAFLDAFDGKSNIELPEGIASVRSTL